MLKLNYIYAIKLHPDDTGGFYVTCRDLPELNSSGDTREEAKREATDAIETTLSIYTDNGQPIPMASSPQKDEVLIYLSACTTAKIILWNTLVEKGISQAELGRRLGISAQAAGRLFDFLHNSKIEKVEEALEVLGKHLQVTEVELETA